MAKTELEDAGLETDGMVESTAKLRQEILALSGVDIMENANEFKSTYKIMDELAAKWEDLSDIQQASITELIAGKRQGNIVSSLMSNFDTARDALETSLNSSGSAMREHEKWQQSLEAQINSLKASWQGLSQAFLSSDFLKVAFNGVINLVDGLTKLIDTLGAFPVLTGTIAATLSGFKNIGIFKTIDSDLVGFTNHIGIANKSFAEMAAAFKSAKTTNDIKGFWSGLKEMTSTVVTGLSSFDRNAIAEYNKLVQQGGATQEQLADAMKGTSVAAQNLAAAANGTEIQLQGVQTGGIGAALGLTTAKVAAIAFNAALTMGISLAIQFVMEGLMAIFNASDDLAEKVDELTSKFEQEHDALMKLKGDYDTTNEDSMISKYEKLSKGVDNLGRNVSLTSDEYSEYQDIVNSIADQIPSLVSGYDEQGNALLFCKDNVEELTAAYEKLIHAQNQKVLTNSGKIEKDFKNQSKDASEIGFWESFFHTSEELPTNVVKKIKEALNNPDSLNAILGTELMADFSPSEKDSIRRALKDANVDIKWYQDPVEVLKETIKTDPIKVKNIIDNHYSQFSEAVEKQKTIAQAKLSEAFDISSTISGLDYGNISEDLQNVARQVVNSLDKDFFDNLQAEGISVEDWTKDMLDQLKTIGKEDSAEISAAFDLQTQFNGGEISYGEYVKSLENTGKLIDGLDLDEEIESQLKLSIGLDEDGLVAEYQRLRERLASDEHFNIMPSAYVPFIESLSSEELSVIWDVIPKLEATEYKEDIADIKAALEKEMMLQGLTFDLNLEVEAAGLEALNTALTESVSATGLSSESIAALKGRYADLESQGYDLSSMFEETSTGIRLNRQEFNKLENAYATDKLAEVDSELTEMKSTYDDLGEAIKNCDDPIRKSELFNERQTLAKRISEAATLAHQYKGLTNAYNDWLKAEESGQERDMYENIIKGWETIDDEISRGWIDDGAIEFLELLTGRTDLAGKSGKQLKEIYDGLDNTIKNTTYSVRDFFTVDEDGNSTNTGVYNFLDAIGQLEEEKFLDKNGKPIDVVKRDKDDNVIGFDFELAGGDEVIAEALGVSEELVQIMVRAADDAGFVVSMDGTYRQLADLQNEAKAAADYLHQIGKTDFEFDFNTTSVENLKTQLEEAHKILDSKEFWNKDGTFNFNADGATQAMQVVSTLQAKLDNLTSEKYGIGLTVEDEEFEEPLENLQEYGRTIQTLNQLKLNPKANAEEIKELNGELNEIAEYFANLDGETKVKLGFESDDGIEEVKKKIESGEIEIPTVLDIQTNMDKNLETLADLALLNSGLLSKDEEKVIEKKYKIEAKADDVDTSDVEEKVETAVIDGLGNPILSREANIEVIAETFGIEDVDDLSSKLEGLDDKTIQAIAEAVGQGDVDALQIAIDGMDGNTVQAVAEALGYSDVETLKAAVRNMQGNEVDAKVNTEGQAQKVWDLQSIIDGLKGMTVNITLGIKKAASSLWGFVTGNKGSTRNDSNGFSEVNGTANVNGTTGKAFKQGSWGTKNSGTALVGELGREVLVRDGRYYTIGDNGAEFVKYKQGDIIFNHRQTEELFNNGKVTSGGGRAKAFASGTAFSAGSGGIGRFNKDNEYIVVADADGNKSNKRKSSTPTVSYSSRKSGSSGSSGSGGGDNTKVDGSAVGTQKEAEKFKETWDWVAVAIERIEREIDNLDQKVGNVYQSWGSRNASLTKEISKVEEEITLQANAAKAYLKKAKSVGLTEKDSNGRSYAELIQEGALNIEDFEGEENEALVEKIKEYQKWYDLYLGCVDAVSELQETESKLYEQRFENVQSQYDSILQGFGHTESMLNEYISQAEAKGYIVSEKYYNALIANEKSNIEELKKEQSALIKTRDEAEKNGIDKNSESYANMCAEIDGVTQEIESGTTALIEYANSIRDIDWQVFDLIQERISDVTAEADFLIDLMSNEKLFDDNGKMTDKGLATMGLHSQNVNTYMYQADDYGNKVAEIDRKIASGELDPYDDNVIAKRRKYLELQRESILNAEQEKQSIKDLVEEAYDAELNALEEKISLYQESLDSQKDLYDYQKQVSEQADNIANLRKMLSAYENDDSEESKKRVQELKLELENAKDDLAETEYEKLINDSETLLSSLYEEYELILNERLDNVDALLSDMIAEINASASTISTTLTAEVANVGTTLSEAMKDIWSGEGEAKSVIAEYGKNFQDKLTTTNLTLDSIKANVDRMVDDVDKDAQKKVETPKTQPSSKADPTKNNSNNNNKSNNDNKAPSSTGDGKPKVGDKVKFVSGKYYYNSQGKKPLGSKNLGKQVYITSINTESWATHPYHISTSKKLGVGDLGWLKLNQISGYASGKKNFLNNEIAWTQESGKEFIIRPSDGAILTPVARGDSVLNAQASSNIWDMANSPAEFIKDNLKLSVANSVPNNSNVQNVYNPDLDKIIISLPNVHNYKDFMSELQKDPNFKRFITSMTIDQIAGKSSLAVNKSIR